MIENRQRIGTADLGTNAGRGRPGPGGVGCLGLLRTREKAPGMVPLGPGQPGPGMPLDKARIQAIGHDIGVPKQSLEKAHVGRNAFDPKFAERPVSAVQGLFVDIRTRVSDHLAQQAIEIGIRLEARIRVMIDANARPRRRLENREGSAGGTRRTILGHGFHIDSHLNRIAPGRNRLRRAQPQIRQAPAIRQLELQGNQIHSGHFLGHRMLNLKPGVGLHEGKCRVRILPGRDEELEGAKPQIVKAVGHSKRGIQYPFPNQRIQGGAGRHFDHLLVAALERALALPEMSHRLSIPGHLHLDVPGLGHPLLGVEIPPAKILFGFRGAARIRVVHLVGAGHPAHSPPAPTGDRLDEQSAAFTQGAQKISDFVHGCTARGPAQDRNPEFFGQGPGLSLVPQPFQGFHAGPHKNQARRPAPPGEVRRLAQKPITRMNPIAARFQSARDNLFGVEIGRRPGARQR